MAQLGSTFDANEVEPQGDYTPIPPGDYTVQIISSEMVGNKAGTGSFLKLELEIADGPQAGRKLFDRLNLDNPNSQAVEIAQRTLSAICHAVGKLTVDDSEQLHMLPMVVKVVVDPARGDYGPSNSIKAYKPAGGAAPVAAAPAAKPAAAKAADSTPPWKKKAA